MRVAFFADLHIYGSEIQSQADLGAPSKIIPKRAQKVLNSVEPDLIFNLGDTTSFGQKEEWTSYKKWKEGLNAPVWEIFGNHDRTYNIYCDDRFGEEFFTELGWVSDTKAVKIGNVVFILVSEEYSPAGNSTLFTTTVPQKRINFIESILEKYSKNNNVIVLTHTPISGTTVLSTRWMCNNPQIWWRVSKKYLDLYERYNVLAHISGHTHIDYRNHKQVWFEDHSKTTQKRGKFVDGSKVGKLPSTYFLNMPCVSVSHGWLSGRLPFLIGLDDSYGKWDSTVRKLQLSLDSRGIPLVDIAIKMGIMQLLGKSAIYYIDFEDGSSEVEVITRELESNKNSEATTVGLNIPLEIPEKVEVSILETDLSLRKYSNLLIQDDCWFEVKANKKGIGYFSKGFRELTYIRGISIEGEKPEDYEVLYKGSKDMGKNWDSNWSKSPEKLGLVNSVRLKIIFNPQDSNIKIQDVKLVTDK
jgi:Icc-related predicted phosphoesterase